MSHTITETATFDTPVTVPDGTDAGSTRSEQVTDIAQRLANRTKFLKVVTDDAVTRSGTQTITGTKTFSATLTASGALHVGGLSTVADVDADDVTATSVACSGDVTGANLGAAFGTVTSLHVVTSTVHASGAADFDAGLSSHGDVVLDFGGGAVNFAQIGSHFPLRSLTAPLAGQPTDASKWARSDLGWQCTSADSIRFPLPKLPQDGSLASVNVCYYTASGLELAIVKMAIPWGTAHPAAPTESYAALTVSSPVSKPTTTGGGSFSDVATLIMSGSNGYVYDNSVEQLCLLVNAGTGDSIAGLRVNFYDCGYRSQ